MRPKLKSKTFLLSKFELTVRYRIPTKMTVPLYHNAPPNTRITPCENCIICVGSVSAALLLFILGAVSFIFIRSLMDNIFAA